MKTQTANTILSTLIPLALDVVRNTFDINDRSMKIENTNSDIVDTDKKITVNLYFNVYPVIKSKNELLVEGRNYEDQY